MTEVTWSASSSSGRSGDSDVVFVRRELKRKHPNITAKSQNNADQEDTEHGIHQLRSSLFETFSVTITMDQSLLSRLSPSHCCSYNTVKSWLPILSWLPKYNLKWLQMDVLAGLTVGLTAIPQALAYAAVADLPVQFGLYSAFMGGFIYTVLGTSKDVTLGPTAIMSLLCFSVVGGQPHRAVLLSLLCGLIQTTMALLRLGFLLDFISYPVIKGFTCAAAITIGFGQVKNILGLRDVPSEFVLQVYYTFAKIPEARVGDVVLGLVCLIVLLTLVFMKKTLPEDQAPTVSILARKLVWTLATMRNALVVIGASLIAYSLDGYGDDVFTITGKTAQGLPPFRPPPMSDTTANGTTVTFGEIVQDFGEGLAVIPFMGLLESIAIAKAFGSQNGYRIVANQTVNSQTGVCTPAGGIVTKLDLLPFGVTFFVSFWEVQYGIIAGIVVSGALLLYNTARPQIKKVDDDILLLELRSGLRFPAAEYLSNFIYTNALQAFPSRSVVLDCHHVSGIDYTVVNEIRDLQRQFKVQGVRLVFARLEASVLKVLLAADLQGLRHGDTVEDALQEALNLHSD
ncbi:hypothetical protein WMY93_006619 [Mugilogobius chulae]|uniref:STAS domain-containing protein n=1 Tax=Mugilogobius chulae TaxID=88201 RepID=A0AAW0PNU2_9GOBI